MVLTISKPPVELDETLIGIVEDVCCTYHIPTKIMASGASHDASPLAGHAGSNGVCASVKGIVKMNIPNLNTYA